MYLTTRRKHTAVLALLLIAIMLLSACSGGSNQNSSSSPAPSGSGGSSSSGSDPGSSQAGPVTGNSAEIAAEAAKKFAGQTLTLTYEAGLQAENPKAIKDEWEKATGVKLNIVELPFNDLYSKAVAEHVAGSGAFDVMQVCPCWLSDLVESGVVVPSLDGYIGQYMNPKDMEDINPVFREANQKYNGHYVALVTDGDVFISYYRKDLFGDPTEQAGFKAKYGYDLAPPKDWQQFRDAAEWFTRPPNLYGTAIQRGPGQNYYWFLQHFNSLGGEYFDPNTMKPQINGPVGVQAMNQLLELNKFMPPGAENWGFVEVLQGWLDGKVAMINTWPPIGKWSEGYGADDPHLSWVPKSKVTGKTGYFVVGRPQMAAGLTLTLSADSKNQELAYLFMQWYTSPDIMLKWITLPYSLGKPVRISHYNDPQLRSLWPTAGEWADTIQAAGEAGHMDVNIAGSKEFHDAIDQATSAAVSGVPAQQALDEAARKWEDTVNRIGVDTLKTQYASYRSVKAGQP